MEPKRKVTQERLDDLAKMVYRILKEEKPWKERSYSQMLLARRMDISPHLLTRVLSESIHKNLTILLNDFRVREAADILERHPEMRAKDVAAKVGFGSADGLRKNWNQRHTTKYPTERKPKSKT